MVDPKLHYCQCGLSWRPRLYHKLVMLVFGSYTRRCSQCGGVMEFRLCNHVVKIKSEQIKDKESLWRRC